MGFFAKNLLKNPKIGFFREPFVCSRRTPNEFFEEPIQGSNGFHKEPQEGFLKNLWGSIKEPLRGSNGFFIGCHEEPYEIIILIYNNIF